MVKLSVIQASKAIEREQIYRFRYRVYVEELGMTTEADDDRQWLRDELDDYSTSYAIVAKDEILESLRMTHLSEVPSPDLLIKKFGMEPAIEKFGTSGICLTSRFILDRTLRHGKVIFRLMKAAFLEAQRRKVALNYGDCSPHLVPFYEHLGYRRYSLGYNDTAYGFKLPIVMLMEDIKFFERVRSPLRRLVLRKTDDIDLRNWFQNTYPQYQNLASASFLEDNDFFDLLTEEIANDPLHQVSLLKGLTQEEAQQFLREATLIELQPGDLIIRRGERDQTVFVLLAGLADIIVGERDKPPLTTVGPGDSFGAVGFLTMGPRTVDVLARTYCKVLVLSGKFIEQFVPRQPLIASKVLFNLSRELAGRLASSNRQMNALVETQLRNSNLSHMT
jgi:CRP-like cAMP-binding protein